MNIGSGEKGWENNEYCHIFMKKLDSFRYTWKNKTINITKILMKFLLLRVNIRLHGVEGDKIKSRGLGKACIKIIIKMLSNL